MAADPGKGFFARNFSLFFGLTFLSVLMALLLPAVFHRNPNEELIELKGHLRSLSLDRGPVAEKSVFLFNFQEFPGPFRVTGISELDQGVLATERKGNEFTFAVRREEYENGNGIPVIRELSSSKNTYLGSDQTVPWIRRGRAGAIFSELALLACFGWLAARLRGRYLTETGGSPNDGPDPMLASIASFLASYLGGLVKGVGWIQNAVEKEKQAEAVLAARPETETPKYVKAVQLLLKNGVDLNQQNESGQTPLHMAAEGNHGEAVDLLLRSGAQADLQDSLGETALMLAVNRGHLGVVMKLLAARANVLLKNKYGDSVLELAQRKKNVAILDLLVKAVARAEAEAKAAAEAAAAEAAKKQREGV